MAQLIVVRLRTGEKIICDKCGHESVGGETVILDLDWYRLYPKKIYCSNCKEEP